MTTPESITVSLEWAKKLKEAGWPQEPHIFTWGCGKRRWEHGGEVMMTLNFATGKIYGASRESGHWFAAPTAEEILRSLPITLPDRFQIEFWRRENWDDESWIVGYSKPEGDWFNKTGDTLANAAASLYCYLGEQNLLPKP